MQTVYVSNRGDDKHDGLSDKKPVRSWKRLKELCKGNNEIVLIEGDVTLLRLTDEVSHPRRHPE
jgi:hypothetical protein